VMVIVQLAYAPAKRHVFCMRHRMDLFQFCKQVPIG
jgi:hypothetical protein